MPLGRVTLCRSRAQRPLADAHPPACHPRLRRYIRELHEGVQVLKAPAQLVHVRFLGTPLQQALRNLPLADVYAKGASQGLYQHRYQAQALLDRRAQGWQEVRALACSMDQSSCITCSRGSSSSVTMVVTMPPVKEAGRKVAQKWSEDYASLTGRSSLNTLLHTRITVTVPQTGALRALPFTPQLRTTASTKKHHVTCFCPPIYQGVMYLQLIQYALSVPPGAGTLSRPRAPQGCTRG